MFLNVLLHYDVMFSAMLRYTQQLSRWTVAAITISTCQIWCDAPYNQRKQD